MANPVDEHFVGVAHPLAQMHELEPGFDGECFQEAPGIGDVLIDAPGVRPVAPLSNRAAMLTRDNERADPGLFASRWRPPNRVRVNAQLIDADAHLNAPRVFFQR